MSLGIESKERKEILNTFSILKIRKISFIFVTFFVYINSRAHSYTVTWFDFIGICILRLKLKWWLHSLTLMFNLFTVLSLGLSVTNETDRLNIRWGARNRFACRRTVLLLVATVFCSASYWLTQFTVEI